MIDFDSYGRKLLTSSSIRLPFVLTLINEYFCQKVGLTFQHLKNALTLEQFLLLYKDELHLKLQSHGLPAHTFLNSYDPKYHVHVWL